MAKNKNHEDMCLKDIGLHVQNTLTILSLIVNIIEGTYVTFLWPAPHGL